MGNVIYFLTHFIMQNILCLFVCLFVCPGSAKEVMLNQPADARSLSHQASRSRNWKYIQHCSPLLFFFLFFLVLYSLPSIHINRSFPLTLSKRENRFVFYLQRRKKIFFSLYSIYLCHHLSYPTFHTCMIGFIMTVHFLYCIKLFSCFLRESQKNALILTTQLGPLFSCSSFINGVELVKWAVETWTLHDHMLCVQ